MSLYLRKILVKVKLIKGSQMLGFEKIFGKMYFAYIRPLFEYSDVVWDNCSLESKRY